MHYSSGFLRKLAATAAIALTFSSCHRAEYTALPKTSSPYHATYHAPVQPAPAAVAQKSATPAAPAPAAPAVAPATAASQPAKVPATAPQRTKLLQKMLANKVAKKADKLTSRLLKQPRNTAEVNRISGYLRTGILLVLIGLLLTILPGSTFQLVGTIVAIIGVVFLALWLLDEL